MAGRYLAVLVLALMAGCASPKRHCQNSDAFALVSHADFVPFAAECPSWASACLEGIEELQSGKDSGSVLIRLIRHKGLKPAYECHPDITRFSIGIVNRLEFCRSEYLAGHTNSVFRTKPPIPKRRYENIKNRIQKD